MNQKEDDYSKHVYLVDILKDGQWVTQVRKYFQPQNPKDHPDRVDCKNFRPLTVPDSNDENTTT